MGPRSRFRQNIASLIVQYLRKRYHERGSINWHQLLIDLQVYKARKQPGGETTRIGKSISGRKKREREKTHEREKKPSGHMTAAGPSKHLERANSLNMSEDDEDETRIVVEVVGERAKRGLCIDEVISDEEGTDVDGDSERDDRVYVGIEAKST
ncbi:hypothetical protein PDE_06592 [Penicillium oxalicum 114-2]|uniref:Uncharacterized protein n=1 Tax=Penicillium oxalicum (strain 114-2 / CGMCC 5302) TaxID=933388 RepID=S8BA06_PENO1|nr:hypothetical protein PDE_06592 [Penicillium oxalicum 114-2]